jgi:hypothetical protein
VELISLPKNNTSLDRKNFKMKKMKSKTEKRKEKERGKGGRREGDKKNNRKHKWYNTA